MAQPGDNTLSSLDYTINGGYWSIIAAIQDPVGPQLSVRRTTTNTVVVSWPNSALSYQLLEKVTLNATTWAVITNAPKIVRFKGDEYQKQIVVPANLGSRFYKLQKR